MIPISNGSLSSVFHCKKGLSCANLCIKQQYNALSFETVYVLPHKIFHNFLDIKITTKKNTKKQTETLNRSLTAMNCQLLIFDGLCDSIMHI